MSASTSNPNVEAIYPLTPGQEGMLFHAIDAPDSASYFQQYVCMVRGALDHDAFAHAWRQVIARHGALRTQFTWEKRDRPLQIVRQTLDLPLTHVEWAAHEADARLAAYLRDDQARGFELSKSPPMRLLLARVGEAHTLVWSWHHLLMDGWSTYCVLREVFAAYDAQINGRVWSPPAPRPFREFVQWLQARDATGDEAFWRAELEGLAGPTTVAGAIRARAPGSGHAQTVRICDAGTTQVLKAFAQRQRVTLNTVVQAAWSLVLSRYCASDDVVFGVTQSGRPAALPGAEAMVGMFIASAPLRARIDAGQPLGAWLADLQARAARMREFEHTPLARVQHWASLPAGRALFDSLLVFENYPMDGALAPASSGLRIDEARHIEQSNYPLAIIVVPAPTLQLFAVYDRALFDAATIDQLLRHLHTALLSMQHAATVGDVDLLDAAERAQVRDEFNATARPWPQQARAHDLIAAQPADAIAAVYRDDSLSYGQLDARARAVAQALRAHGLKTGEPVALCAERSLEMIVGIVGILKAGGAYVPLDPAYPRERLDFMLADSGARVTVMAPNAADESAWPTSVVYVSTAESHQEADAFEAPAFDSDTVAYLIYTSGSTGKPKGVPVQHRNLVHSTLAREGVYEQAPGCFLLLSSFSFDSSIVGLFWTLCSGGKLVLPEPKQEQDIGALADLMGRHHVTHMLALPSLYRLVLDYAEPAALAALRCVIVAGEACTADLVQRHTALLPQAKLYNEYGPTEGTVWSTAYRVPSDFAGNIVPIGRPIPNMRNYVLDARMRLQPVGVAGELVIGGAGVVDGYWRRPELTAERFVTLAPPAGAAEPVYRTGDMARWLPDGTLEFLGRIDNQIKLRGYRVELEEIEGVLNAHPDVRESVVVLRSQARVDLTALEAALAALDPAARDALLADIERLPQ